MIADSIIQYGSNKVRVFCPKIPPENRASHFLWLGIAKPKNIFKLTLNLSNKLFWNFEILIMCLFNWSFFSKYNSTMEMATGLISSLLYVASSRDMPFCQLLSVPVLFTDNTRRWFAIAQYGFIMLLSCIFQSDLNSLQGSFLLGYMYLLVMVHNKLSIATNKVQWPSQFSVRYWILGVH